MLLRYPEHVLVFLLMLAESSSVKGFSVPSATISRSRHLVTWRSAIFSDDDGNSSSDNDEVLKSLMEKYLGGDPSFPTFESRSRPSKSDLYDDSELSSLLDTHKELYPQTEEKRKTNGDDEPENLIPSIHDLVLQTVQEVERAGLPVVEEIESNNNSNHNNNKYSWLTDSIREKIPHLQAVASDVDGTLIGSDQTVHPRTKSAIQQAIQAAFSPLGKLSWFFPATGKTRWGALNSLGPELAALVSQCPGVFIQGLYCVYGDKVIFEKKLTKPAIEAAERLVAESETSIIAYDGDNLYTTDLTKSVVDLHEVWGEPLSQEISSIAGHAPGVHKILICDYDLEKLAQIRMQLESIAEENDATVTQAIPSMLELLPAGCSKALGVQKLCEVLGVDPSTQLLALGDAENDVGMLQMASVGVAVGNGCELAKEAADVVLEETHDEGGAGLAIEVLLIETM